jgi:hypothetical protein
LLGLFVQVCALALVVDQLLPVQPGLVLEQCQLLLGADQPVFGVAVADLEVLDFGRLGRALRGEGLIVRLALDQVRPGHAGAT